MLDRNVWGRGMIVLELFAGSCSFSDVAKEYGHKTFTVDNGLDLFVCGDQLLKGAALNAVQIAEKRFARKEVLRVKILKSSSVGETLESGLHHCK